MLRVSNKILPNQTNKKKLYEYELLYFTEQNTKKITKKQYEIYE